MVTLNQLQVLAILHSTGSFTKAAKELHRAQSAVTYAIKALETELQVPLLDRSGYRAKLTPAGEVILRKAEQILAMANDLTALSLELKEGWEPRLNIVIHGLLPIASLMPLLKEFLGRNHPTQVLLRVEVLGGVLESIENLQPELVVTPLGPLPIPAGYNFVRIGSITMIPVTSPGHPLAGEPSPIPLHVLRKYLHLIVSDSSVARQPMDSLLIGADECWYFPDFFSRLEGLRAGLGFAWMTTYMVEEDIREGRLAPIVVEGQSVYDFDVVVFYRQMPALGPTGRSLLEMLKESPDILPQSSADLLARYMAT